MLKDLSTYTMLFKSFCWYLFLVLWSSLLSFGITTIDASADSDGDGSDASASSSSDESDFYFYANQEDSSPIVEYIAPQEEWTDENSPDFLYYPEKVPGIRVVEFYAHWCPQ